MALSIGGKKADPAVKPKDPVISEAKVSEGMKEAAAVQSIAKPHTHGGELGAILKGIHKNKGEMIAVSGRSIPQVERIATGMFEFDLHTGGGFPRGRYTIVYGPESSGKTNACYCAVATAQRLPAPCNVAVWVDLEGTFDPEWAAYFGVDVDALIVVKPSYGEEAVDMIDELLPAAEVAILIVDSLAVMVAAKELEQSAEKFDVGTSALLIKRLCNKIVMILSEESKRGHSPAVVLINQTRMKIGVMFGDPETMPGGQAMKFLAAMIIRLYGKNKIEKSIHPDLPAFKETKAVIKKAKVPVLGVEFEYDMAVLPTAGNGVGTTNSWNTVAGHLKDMGVLSKVEKGQGWQLLGEEFKTLVPIQDRYLSNPVYAAKLHDLIVTARKGQFLLVGQ